MQKTATGADAGASPRLAPTDPAGIDRCEIGRRIGFDYYTRGRASRAPDGPPEIGEGWRQAQADRRPAKGPDRHERKWLQLRLQAHRRDRVFDPAITPDWLRKIDVDRCPVTREPLTHGQRAPTDGSIDRVHNDGAYAPSNLAVISTRANRAKGDRGFDEVLAFSRAETATHGLQPVEWLRLAGLMLGPSFASRPETAPTIPLVVPVPKGLVVTAMQQTQHVFVQLVVSSRGKNLLIKQFGHACRTEAAQQRLARLADLLHVAAKGFDWPCDVWLHPAAMPALLRWREALDDAAWGLVGEIGRGLAGARRVDSARLAGWQLPSRGYRTC